MPEDTMDTSQNNWSQLPDHILVSIFSYLRYSERALAARVCTNWSEVFKSPYLWTSFTFSFYTPEQSKSLTCLDQYGSFLRAVTVELDQSVDTNRDNACRVITGLAKVSPRRLKYLKVSFKGENPYFYAGQEFINALCVLFGPPQTIGSNPSTSQGSQTKPQEKSPEEPSSSSAAGNTKQDRGESGSTEAGPSTEGCQSSSRGEEPGSKGEESHANVWDSVEIVQPLEEVDLSGLTVTFDDKLFNLMSENHQNLKKLNIQNRVLICKVTPTCILRLVQRCRKLGELRIFNMSLCEDTLLALTEDDRQPLEHLSIICRREEKYIKDIGADTWRTLVNKLPNFRVTLGFDHTCPLVKVSEVMKPEIPVSVLRLETFTYIYDEVRLAAGYYRKTLQKLVLQTPLSRNSPQLNAALIELATECPLLEEMHVYCVLDKETVEKILEVRPKLLEKNSYILRYKDSPHPWKVGKDW